MSVAGQVVIRKNSSLVHKLIDVRKPILTIPNLAIHLETDRTKFEWNNETHLRPILAMQANEKLGLEGKDLSKDEPQDSRSIVNDHHTDFLKLVAEHAGCKVEEIVDLDLYLYDTQPAVNFSCYVILICFFWLLLFLLMFSIRYIPILKKLYVSVIISITYMIWENRLK